MPTGLPTDDKQQQDSRYNPGDNAAAERFSSSHANAGIDQAEAFANDPANHSNPNENIDRVKDLEHNPESQGLYRPTGRTKPTLTNKFQGLLKRKKTIAAIIAALGGGGILVGGGMWFAFNTALLQVDALITKKVDTMSAAVESRYALIMPTKLFGTSTGCALPIECRYTGINQTQLDRMRANGADLINDDGTAAKKNPITGRYSGDKLKLKGVDEPVTAKTYRSMLGKSSELRSLTRIVMKPTWISFNDKTAKAVRANRKLVTNPDWGKTDDSKTSRTTVIKAVNGESSTEKIAAGSAVDEKADKTKAIDTSSAADDINELVAAERAALESGDSVTPLTDDITTAIQQEPFQGKLTASKLLSETLNTISPTGVISGMCTTYQLANLTVLTSRTISLINDMRYASLFLSTAGKIKAGKATPEDVSNSMNILMTPDSNGKTFGDSFAYQLASYGKVTDTPMTAGAGGNDIITTMSAALTATQKFFGAGNTTAGKNFIDTGCFLSNFGALLAIVPGGELVGQLGKAATQGGLTAMKDLAMSTIKTGVSDAIKKVVDKEARQQAVKDARSKILTLAKSPGTSLFVASMLAERVGVPYIAQQIAGTGLVDANGVTAMDTIYAGADAQNAEMAKNRGMVALTKEQAINYQNFNVTYNDQYIADMQAESQPFDLKNPYSQISTMATAFMPTLIKLSSVTTNVSNIASLPSALFSNVKTSLLATTTTHATSQSDLAAQYDYCPASNLGGGVPDDIALSPDCVPVMGIPDVNMLQTANPISLAQQMYAKGQIDANGVPQKEYKDLVEKCMNASGEPLLSEEVVDNCFNTTTNSSADNKLFQIYTLDQGTLDGVDQTPYEGSGSSAGGSLQNSGNFKDNGWAWPGPKGTTACGFDCYAGHNGMDVKTGIGSTVYAARDGVVTAAGPDKYMTAQSCIADSHGVATLHGTQYTVIIRHTVNGQIIDGVYTHLQADGIKVQVGQQVKAGDLIALSGDTGCTSGAHLHVSLFPGGYPANFNNPLDPTTVLGRSG